MRRILLAAAACSMLIAVMPGAMARIGPDAGSPPPDDIHTSPTLPIKLFVRAFNSGDWHAAAALFAPSAMIIDAIPPYRWHSFDAWRRSFTEYRTALHQTDFHLSMMSFLMLGGSNRADYSVQPGTLTFKQDGVTRVDRGFFTFTTAKIRGRWTITGWSWTNVERGDFWEHTARERPIFD